MSIVFIRVDLTLAVTPVQYDYEKVRTLQIRTYVQKIHAKLIPSFLEHRTGQRQRTYLSLIKYNSFYRSLAYEDPTKMTKVIVSIIHKGAKVVEVTRILE